MANMASTTPPRGGLDKRKSSQVSNNPTKEQVEMKKLELAREMMKGLGIITNDEAPPASSPRVKVSTVPEQPKTRRAAAPEPRPRKPRQRYREIPTDAQYKAL
jgi:hypothetical protein